MVGKRPGALGRFGKWWGQETVGGGRTGSNPSQARKKRAGCVGDSTLGWSERASNARGYF